MKTIIAIAVAIFVSGQVEAAEFAPWRSIGVESQADEVQATVEIGSFYRSGVGVSKDIPSVQQADVVIGPWYNQGRV